MSKDYLAERREGYNKISSSSEIIQELSLRKETESLKRRKEFLHNTLMSKRMTQQSISSLNHPQSQSQSQVSAYINQSYHSSEDKLTFITHLLHAKASILNSPDQISEETLIEEGVILLSQYIDINPNLSSKDAAFFFQNIFFCITERLISDTTSLNTKLEISLILANITNNNKLCSKYSDAFCDKLFLFNLNKYFICQLDKVDKKLLGNIILVISNIMSENHLNYIRVIDQITFLPMLQCVLNNIINNPWAKFTEIPSDTIVLLENSLFLLYNFFFYMEHQKMIDYVQFEKMTIKLMQKAYQESNQEMFLLFLEIAMLFTKSKEVIKVIFGDDQQKEGPKRYDHYRKYKDRYINYCNRIDNCKGNLNGNGNDNYNSNDNSSGNDSYYSNGCYIVNDNYNCNGCNGCNRSRNNDNDNYNGNGNKNNHGLLVLLFSLVNNNNSIPIAVNSIRLIRNVYRSGHSKIKKVIIDMNLEEIVFKNLFFCTNEDALCVYLDLLALLIKKNEKVTQQKLLNYKEIVNALCSIYTKARSITTKVEVIKTMRALIETNNDEVFQFFFIGDFWKGLLCWLKDNAQCNSKNAPLIYRILRLINMMMINCPMNVNKSNMIKIELENCGLDTVIEGLIDSTFHQIVDLARNIYYRYWANEENMYKFKMQYEMID